jgi:Protein of unknown function (DUF4054)
VSSNWNQPNFEQTLELFWGGAYETDAYAAFQMSAANVILGTNPPFGLADFFAQYPIFFGPASPIQVTAVVNTNTVNITANPSGVTPAIGQLISDQSGLSFTPGTFITGVSGNTLTLSTYALASGTGVPFNLYAAPQAPTFIMQLFINLASASLVQARWLDSWLVGMGLFVAHYCTMWMSAQANGPGSTTSQIVAAGLQQGILISRAAGDVSAGTQPIAGLEDYGAWNLTKYGIILATMAQGIGSGMMYIL